MLIFEKIITKELNPTEKVFTFVLIKLSKDFKEKLKQYRETNKYLRSLYLCSTAEKEMSRNADKFSNLWNQDIVNEEKDVDLFKFISFSE